MKNVVTVVPDETIRRLLEVQLGVLGHRVAWSGAASPDALPDGVDVAIVDPAATRAVDLARECGVPCVFVSPLEPTHQTRSLAPSAHLTMPYGLDDLAAAVSG